MKRVITAVLATACCAVAVALPASAAPKAATECTGTLSGSFDSIVVPAGATCTLDGATVSKSVTVEKDASLFTSKSTIGGNLMSRNAQTVRVIDTDVHRNLMVSGTQGITTIGGMDCHVDPAVANNLMLKNNHGNIAVCDLTIARNLVLQGNTRGIGVFHNTVGNNILLFDNTGPANRVRHNDVRINLNCQGNTNKVITVANTAHKIMGQCYS
jgi:hypothetical protein